MGSRINGTENRQLIRAPNPYPAIAATRCRRTRKAAATRAAPPFPVAAIPDPVPASSRHSLAHALLGPPGGRELPRGESKGGVRARAGVPAASSCCLVALLLVAGVASPFRPPPQWLPAV
jgi:hypothetical protein